VTPDPCQLCHKGPARWLCLDPKQHTYLRMTLGKDDEEPEVTKQEDAVLLCNDCRRAKVQGNRASRKPRKMGWMRWDVNAQQAEQ
jgi:hypothetical protein